MAEKYDFGNLSPIEFEALVIDLMGAELGVRFESFSEGADGGIDGRHSSAEGDTILQAKHFKDSTWSDLQVAAKKEFGNLSNVNPCRYYFLTSQKLTPSRKEKLKEHLGHSSVTTSNILGRTELNALLQKHGDVERRNIKLWLSSAAVLQRLLNNDIAVFTEATKEGIERILKVFVANPSLSEAAKILKKRHCLIVSGPPGVGKTTLAQVLATEYCDDDWNLVAISSIEDGHRAFNSEKKQVFIFDDFLGKIKLDERSLARDDEKISSFMQLVSKRDTKRFILTTRAYIFQAAKNYSEALDDEHVELTEMVLDLDVYTREIKARILYNHLYHSSIEEAAIGALLEGDTVARIIDHENYMPRIVQWMTEHFRFQDLPSERYPKRFIDALDNPLKIWDKAFKKHISREARVLLYCMYFSKYEHFPKPGIDLAKLRQFFDRALGAFEINSANFSHDSKFEETLMEVKSSFIVIENDRINFINPSVRDFLSHQVEDKNILSKLAASVPTFEAVAALWQVTRMRFKGRPSASKPVVATLLTEIQAGSVAGRLRLDELGELLGGLLLAENRREFVWFLRQGGLSKNFWMAEAELPSFIDDLMFGKFQEIEHAQAYGRLLRQKLYGYLSEREFILEIEELGLLVENLSMYREDLPTSFQERLEQAIAESLDSLDLNSIPRDGSAETIVGDWLDNLEVIETHFGSSVGSFKRNELEEFLQDIEWQAEMQMKQRRDERSLRRSSSSDDRSAKPVATTGSSGQAHGGFSNSDLDNMFSSLKK